jgi:hypothetical protein
MGAIGLSLDAPRQFALSVHAGGWIIQSLDSPIKKTLPYSYDPELRLKSFFKNSAAAPS